MKESEKLSRLRAARNSHVHVYEDDEPGTGEMGGRERCPIDGCVWNEEIVTTHPQRIGLVHDE